jgi:hypothetical protein
MSRLIYSKLGPPKMFDFEASGLNAVTDNLQTDTPHNGHTNILSMILFPQII